MTWPYVALVLLMLTLSTASIFVITAVRAYVAGEAYWSKAERDAAHQLIRYASSSLDSDYEKFEQAAGVIIGDHAARLELQRKAGSTEVAARGFTAGRNHPEDIAGLIGLFRVFGDSFLMAHAVELWTEGDQLFDQMIALAADMRARAQAGPLSAAQAADYIETIETLHGKLTPVADAFSVELGRISRLVSYAMVAGLAMSSLTLLIAAIAMTRRMIERSQAVRNALRASQRDIHAEQERAQVTLRSIGDAVIAIKHDGTIQYLNTAAETLTGWESDMASGRAFGEVLRLVDDQRPGSMDATLERVLTEGLVIELTNAGSLVHRDGTKTPVNELAAPIRDGIGMIVGVVLVLRDVTQARAMEEQLRFQASHDALTGLTNREEFERRLGDMLHGTPEPGRERAVIYLDLDQFKIVNDTCGHAAGDQLLKQLGQHIGEALPPDAVLARLGGDEFGILLQATGLSEGATIAERVCAAIARFRFSYEGKPFPVGASVGLVVLDGELRTVNAVLSAADRACYLAKDNGRNRVHVYRAVDDGGTRSSQLERAAQVDRAIEEGRLVLYAQEMAPLQAIHDVDSGRFEILLRLVEADGRLVAPMTFIPAAERYGAMARIDRWVIEAAFTALSELRSRGRTLPTCMINLSGHSVTDETLIEFVLELFEKTGIAFDRIGFELTETVAISNLGVAVRLMRRLRELGCTIALDDFGSGMSSFTYLRNLPVQYLKIDGNLVSDFTHNPPHRAMVQAIHQIAQAMGVKTVAEWVEDEPTRIALTAIGIDYAQGFHLGRPEPLARAIEQWNGRFETAPARSVQLTRAAV